METFRELNFDTIMKTIAHILFLIPLLSFSQKQANIWYFGNKAGIDFNQVPPDTLSNGQMSSDEGCAVISTKDSGQLLFYSNGQQVWNKNHQIMPNGNGLYGSSTTTQSAIFVEDPADDSMYYIFTVDYQAGIGGFGSQHSGGMTYSVIDMKLDSARGDIVYSKKNIQLVAPTSEKVTAVTHANGCFTWIITHKWDSDTFYAYLLTDTGLSAAIKSRCGPVIQGSSTNTLGYLKASPNGSKLAFTNLLSVILYDFDKYTGQVSNYVDLTYSSVLTYGLSFSPDSKKLYAANKNFSVNTADYIYQYDLEASSIRNSRTLIGSSSFYNSFGALQLAPDGKIYATKKGESSLGIINFPDSLGLSCNYIDTGFFIGANKATSGLPNFNESIFDTSVYPYEVVADFIFSNTCVGFATQFTDSSTGTPTKWQWDFGDPHDTVMAYAANPTHIYDSVGTYTVRMIVSGGCDYTDTIEKQISIVETNDISLSNDTAICKEDSLILNASGGSKYLWSPLESLSCGNCADPIASPDSTTEYIVYIETLEGCYFTDTVIITVLEISPNILPGDTVIEPGQSIQLLASGGEAYEWSPSEGLSDIFVPDPITSPEHSITYSVMIIDSNNCQATLYINIDINEVILEIPSCFSPNGDGLNDYLSIFYKNIDQLNYFKIYNKWGNLVLQTDDLNFIWDGTEEEVGFYKYYVSVLSKGEEIANTGEIILIR